MRLLWPPVFYRSVLCVVGNSAASVLTSYYRLNDYQVLLDDRRRGVFEAA